MNDTQAASILDLLAANWPNQQLPDPTVDLWLSLLTDLDFETAKTAAQTVVREDTWFPPTSRFLAALEAARHARRNREAADRGLPNPGIRTPSAERFKQHITGLRSQLADRGTRNHWHGGPDPCPVCGGIAAPKVTTSRPRRTS